MIYSRRYSSPLGDIILAVDDTGLTGMKKAADCAGQSRTYAICCSLSYILPFPSVCFKGLFHQKWRFLLRGFPLFRQGPVSRAVLPRRSAGLSAQAVGGAVGHNPISLIVPCHRVIGSDGSLTGYGGGIERKIALLKLEGIAVRV